MEYFGCKTAANDMTMSIMGARPTDGPIKFSMDDQLTILGWWEHARYARAFKPGLQARMQRRGDEFRLRQDDSGEWRVTPFTSHRHRIATRDFAKWTVDCAADAPAELRVESLYAADHAATNAAIRVLDASMAGELTTSAASGVTVSFAKSGDGEHGETLKITAKNASAPEKGSWACVSRSLPEKTFAQINPVSTLWIKGDGSGATLNIHISRTSSIYEGASAEHYLKLDFRGWRRFDYLMRETDSDKAAVFEWPYWDKQASHSPAGLFRTLPVGRTVGAVGYYLNGIRPGTKVEVEVSELEVLDEAKTSVEGAAVSVGGKQVVVPFALSSGDYAELRGGVWTKYLPSGEPVGRVRTGDRVFLAKGRNDVSVGAAQRLEVTLLAPGRWEEALDGNMS